MVNSKNSTKGVTILELVIVVTIMSILAVSAFQYYGRTVSTARMTRAKMDMNEIKKAVKKYAITTQGIYPQSLSQIKGDYKIPKSPYGSDYKLDPEKHEIVLVYYENNVKKELRKKYRPD